MAEKEVIISRTGIPGVDLISSLLEEQSRILKDTFKTLNQAGSLSERVALADAGLKKSQEFNEVIVGAYEMLGYHPRTKVEENK